MVTANDTQEESTRNSSILIDIVPIKPITLSSNYGKNIQKDSEQTQVDPLGRPVQKAKRL
ncbi:26909_t:CDS:2 [Dentiscutata erythropus]|uniref:26909_t:CDS:1 n=1 Tax=Dentiscutata erythropus TaxID=1348616 RepID=A0A9N9G320_9GLOM|nr:26909_t:CDS:2 [Dentiscutata erythropus]